MCEQPLNKTPAALQKRPHSRAHSERGAGAAAPAPACRKGIFDRRLDFLKLEKSFKKSFDPTRKGTLTVPFHTILPSEHLGRKA